MIDPSLLLKVINTSKENAAKELEISNQLLDIVRRIIEESEDNKTLSEDTITEISTLIIDKSQQLTKSSKELNKVIAQAVGIGVK